MFSYFSHTGVPARSFAGATHAIPPGGETLCLQRMWPPVHSQEQLATARVGAHGHQVRDWNVCRFAERDQCGAVLHSFFRRIPLGGDEREDIFNFDFRIALISLIDMD